jgi:NADPH:quinone reductase-like Zn-dependent oxidoreductase
MPAFRPPAFLISHPTTWKEQCMRAIVVSRHGGPDVLEIRDIPDPRPADDEVLVRVRAFGLNHADVYMRSGVWSFGIPVLGIECAGTVEHDPSERLPRGAAVVALVGGLARTRNGTYAELVSVPAGNVTAVRTSLPWEQLAALPEAYATAWTALHANLALDAGDTVLVRGGTASLGQAAVNIAVDAGATVIATTRNAAREPLLRVLGSDRVLIDDGRLAEQLGDERVDAVLDLVGNATLRDSLACVKPRGGVCQLGFLGGLDPVPEFNPLADLPSGVQLSTFASAFVLGDRHFPLADVPMQAIVDRAAQGIYRAEPVAVFDFAQIVEAHRALEANRTPGKLVVRVEA